MAKKRPSLFLPALVVGAVGTIVVGWFFVLPGVVERRVIAEAAARGVALTVGHVTLAPTEVTLERLAATVPSVPGVTLDIASASVSLSGFAPTRLALVRPTLRVPSVQSLGALAELGERARAGKSATGEGTAAPPSALAQIVITEGRASIGDPAPAAPSVDVTAITFTIGRDPNDAFVGATAAGSGQLTVALDATHRGGPWLLAVTKTPAALERTVDLFPAAPGTAFARATDIVGGESKLVVKVAHKTLTELLAPGLSTIAPADAALDVDIDHQLTASRARGHVDVGVSRFVFAAAASPAPLRVSFDYDGQPNAARLARGTFALGPMRGTVAGNLDFAAAPGPAKAQVSFSAAKVPCATLARSLAEEALPGVGAALGALGLDKAAGELVTGEVGVSGEATIDLGDLRKARVVAHPEGGCSVDLPFLPKTR